VLYLTEVKNQNRGIIGGYKTELKLLARQDNDQIWSPIIAEEVAVCDSINEQISKGTLFIVNLGANNQIQGTPELAGPRLVNFLKHFSRILEKSKTQEEEIEQWQVSLKMQAEEIANRQAELDAQQEQLQEKEAELKNLQEERDKLHEAWQQIGEEQRKLQETMSREQLDEINSLLTRFSASIVDFNLFQEDYRQILEAVNNQQASLDGYWQQLEPQKNQAQQLPQEVGQQDKILKQRRQDLNSTWETLQQAKIDLQIQQNLIINKEELLGQINLYVQGIDNLKKEVTSLMDDGGDSDSEHRIDIKALENMPLGELEGIVENLKQEMSKLVNFVNMQEEELTLQGDFVKEIEAKLAQASDIDKFSLETELAEAQEAMKLLNETLVGQRLTLKKQQKILNQHIKILSRRQGIFDVQGFEPIDLDPILISLEEQRNNSEKQKQKLELEIQHLRQTLQPIQQTVERQNNNYHQQAEQLKQDEENWQQAQLLLVQMELKVRLLEEVLNSLQEPLNNLRHNLENMEPAVRELEAHTNEQNQVLQEMQAMINN
jgi:chromosome segregation ATPase